MTVDEKMDMIAWRVESVSDLRARLPKLGDGVFSLDGEGGTFYVWAHPAGGLMTFDTAWGGYTWFPNRAALLEQLIDEE